MKKDLETTKKNLKRSRRGNKKRKDFRRFKNAAKADVEFKRLHALSESLRVSFDSALEISQSLVASVQSFHDDIYTLCALSGVDENELIDSKRAIDSFFKKIEANALHTSTEHTSTDRTLENYTEKPRQLLVQQQNHGVVVGSPSTTPPSHADVRMKKNALVQRLVVRAAIMKEAEKCENAAKETPKSNDFATELWSTLRAKVNEHHANLLTAKAEEIFNQNDWLQLYVRNSSLSLETVSSWCAAILSFLPYGSVFASPITALTLSLSTRRDRIKIHESSLDEIRTTPTAIQDSLEAFLKKRFDLEFYKTHDKETYNMLIFTLNDLIRVSQDIDKKLMFGIANLQKKPEVSLKELTEFKNIILKLSLREYLRHPSTINNSDTSMRLMKHSNLEVDGLEIFMNEYLIPLYEAGSKMKLILRKETEEENYVAEKEDFDNLLDLYANNEAELICLTTHHKELYELCAKKITVLNKANLESLFSDLNRQEQGSSKHQSR